MFLFFGEFNCMDYLDLALIPLIYTKTPVKKAMYSASKQYS